MAVNKIFGITLDTKVGLTNRQFTVVEGDNGNRIDIEVVDDNVPVNLEGCRVLAVFAKPTGTSSQGTLEEDGGGIVVEGNHVLIDLYTSSFSVGNVECELQIYSGEDKEILVTTAKFNFNCRAGIFNDETVQSTNEHPILTELIEQVKSVAEGVPWLPHADPNLFVVTKEGGQLIAISMLDALALYGIDADVDNYAIFAKDGLLTAMPAEGARSALGAAAASVELRGVLKKEDWQTGVQTVQLDGITGDTHGIVTLPSDASEVERISARVAQLFLVSQDNGEVTIKVDGVQPIIDIPFVILAVG